MCEEISGIFKTVMQGLKSYGIPLDMLDVTMEAETGIAVAAPPGGQGGKP